MTFAAVNSKVKTICIAVVVSNYSVQREKMK